MERPRDEVAPLIFAKNFGRHRRHDGMTPHYKRDARNVESVNSGRKRIQMCLNGVSNVKNDSQADSYTIKNLCR